MSSVSLVAEQVLFAGGFLAIATLLHETTKKVKVPFTVALLALGFATRWLLAAFHIPMPFSLSPDIIYFVLLPLLLFGAAMHINLHQFRLQFRTITFAATFGLLVSVMLVGGLTAWLLGLPIADSLLFGALISATDPIAVLALFQRLGAPRRLALLADGESMFNDATAVIVFRVLAGIVLAGEHVSSELVIGGLGEFVYVFVGSLVAGAAVGYLISQLISWIQDDPMVETTLTIVGALVAFVGMEHFLHLSGVISAVAAGLVMGNLGRSRLSASVIEFVRTFWDYLGFLAIGLVFFFSALEIDLTLFLHTPHRYLTAVFIILIARAVSVYLSFAITNKSKLFTSEPDVPLSWQHILMWGGLRGVIPLVLVFSLPEEYVYREDILGFTLAIFLFTLFVNGMTIEWLLKKLRLHHPRAEEEIIREQDDIFRAEEARERLQKLSPNEFNVKLRELMDRELKKEIQQHERILLRHSENEEEMERSLLLQTVYLQRKILERLFREGHLSEDVMFDFETQLDLHTDSLEYPDKFSTRGLTKDGAEKGKEKFEKTLLSLQYKELSSAGFLRSWYRARWEEVVLERYSLMRVRVIAAEEVIEYLEDVSKILGKVFRHAVEIVRSRYETYITYNLNGKQDLENRYPELIRGYRRSLISKLIHTPERTEH